MAWSGHWTHPKHHGQTYSFLRVLAHHSLEKPAITKTWAPKCQGFKLLWIRKIGKNILFCLGLVKHSPTLSVWECSTSSWGSRVDRWFNKEPWPMPFKMTKLSFYRRLGKHHIYLNHKQNYICCMGKPTKHLVSNENRHTKPCRQKKVFTTTYFFSPFCLQFCGKRKMQ